MACRRERHASGNHNRFVRRLADAPAPVDLAENVPLLAAIRVLAPEIAGSGADRAANCRATPASRSHIPPTAAPMPAPASVVLVTRELVQPATDTASNPAKATVAMRFIYPSVTGRCQYTEQAAALWVPATERAPRGS